MKPNEKIFRLLELLFLFVFIPGLIIYNRWAVFMLPFLWGATIYCGIVYGRHYFEGWKKLWNWQAVNRHTMKFVLLRWVTVSILMLIFIYFYDPARMFSMWRERPDFIPRLLILYPIISALPQEFLFCTFFFKRYEIFFRKTSHMIIASAVVFAYAHVLFINPVAPVLSLFGGLLFAMDFAKYRSLALVTIEHGLYGNSLFLIGLGWYFWHGSVALP